MQTIPSVDIALLHDHAALPSREAVLALFADHYRGSIARAAHAANHDDLPVELLVPGPATDFAPLAADGGGFFAAEPAEEHGDSSFGDGGFDLGADPFGAFGDEEPTESPASGPDVFALADAAPAPLVSAVRAEPESDEELEAELQRMLDEEAAEEARAALGDVALADVDVDVDDVELAVLAGDDEGAAFRALEPLEDEPASVFAGQADDGDEDENHDDEDAASASVGTEELLAVAADASVARDDDDQDATTMIPAVADDDAGAGAAAITLAYGDEATTVVAPLPDDELDGPSDDGTGADGSGVERPTRRSRRATRKVKRDKA